jgi:hypothetical protein
LTPTKNLIYLGNSQVSCLIARREALLKGFTGARCDLASLKYLGDTAHEEILIEGD